MTQRASYNEEGEIANVEDVNRIIVSELKAVDEHFIYLGNGEEPTLAINLASIASITTDPAIIAEWLNITEDSISEVDKEVLN